MFQKWYNIIIPNLEREIAMKTNKMKTVYVSDTMVSEESLKAESKYISDVTSFPYVTVLSIIKGIDVYYYLMGLQDEPTFDDCGQFLVGDIQPHKYDPNCMIDDNEMFDFISSHMDIPDEIIKNVMMEDCRYQNLI